MAKIYISPNLRKLGIAQAVQQTCEVLREHGAEILMPREASMLCDTGVTYVNREEGIREADAMVVLGGDGTILRIAELAARYGTPILGVNLGHVGFMTELEPGEIALVARLCTDDFTIDDRMMLSVKVLREGICVYHGTALNEAMVSKIRPFHIIHMRLASDGETVADFKGDGLILATPTGTTAYSHSAGGPIIEPTAENIAVTPVCPFTIGAKPLVFSPHRKLTVCVSGAGSGGACVSVDGAEGFELLPDDVVMVERAEHCARLIRVKNRNFYQILRHKLCDGGDAIDEVSKTGENS